MVSIRPSEEKFSQNVFDQFCQNNGLIFPQSFIQFIKQYNDGELETNIVVGYDTCSVRYFYGTTSEGYSNIEDVYHCFIGRMPYKCIPIAEAEGGNQVCMSLNSETYGKIYFWDHETMDVDEGEECRYGISDMPLIASSFDELLEKITAC